jgi:hypothetical protein
MPTRRTKTVTTGRATVIEASVDNRAAHPNHGVRAVVRSLLAPKQSGCVNMVTVVVRLPPTLRWCRIRGRCS